VTRNAFGQKIEQQEDVLATATLARLIKEALSDLRRRTPSALFGMADVTSGAEAADIIERLTRWTTGEARRATRAHSAAAWLAILRRRPLTLFSFTGEFEATPALAMRIAESLASQSVKAAHLDYVKQPDGSYAVSPEMADRSNIAALLAAAERLTHLDAIRRTVSRGADLRVIRHLGEVTTEETVDLRERLRDYDRRLEQLSLRWHPFLRFERDTVHPEQSLLVAARILPSHQRITPTDRFAVHRISLDDRARDEKVVDAAAQLPERRTVAAIALLAQASTTMVLGTPATLDNLTRVGYWVVEEQNLLEALDVAISALQDRAPSILSTATPSDGAEAIRVLQAITDGGTMRFARPLLVGGGGFLVDLVAVGDQLRRRMLLNKSGGEAVNVLGYDFEPDVQRAVDDALGRPANPTLQDLRGRPLRLHKEVVTDIDAFAEIGDVLCLISCKAFEYTAEYDSGEFGAVRASSTSVRDAVRTWRKRVHRLRQNPVGDNYNFAGRKLIGVVVTPYLLFTDEPIAEDLAGEVAPGLREYLPLAELEKVLRRVATTTTDAQS